MRRWYVFAVVAGMACFSAWAYGRLPQQLAIHWGLTGEANGWGSRTLVTVGLPLLCAALIALFLGVRQADPLQENYEKFEGSFDLITGATTILVAAFEVAIVGKALGWPMPMERVGPALAGLFLIAIGNVFPRLRSNSFFGVRTPWTLSDDGIWSRTQRIAGYGLVVAGLLFVATAAAPRLLGASAGVAVAAAVGVGAVIYSAYASLAGDS